MIHIVPVKLSATTEARGILSLFFFFFVFGYFVFSFVSADRGGVCVFFFGPTTRPAASVKMRRCSRDASSIYLHLSSSAPLLFAAPGGDKWASSTVFST